mmetsp:Transcript_103286/g.262272  ORF Transcript_103286/g.262272 Transcript_103286/m.262272 type:complete len:682 (+) Transcript_103286:576-2621(+)
MDEEVAVLQEEGRALVALDGHPADHVIPRGSAPHSEKTNALLHLGASQGLQDLAHLQAAGRLGLDGDVLAADGGLHALVEEPADVDKPLLTQGRTLQGNVLKEPLGLAISQLQVVQALHEGRELLTGEGLGAACGFVEELLPRLLSRGHPPVDGGHALGQLLIDLGVGLLHSTLQGLLDRRLHACASALRSLLAAAQAGNVPLRIVPQVDVGGTLRLHLEQLRCRGFRLLQGLGHQVLGCPSDRLHLICTLVVVPSERLRLILRHVHILLGRHEHGVGLVQNFLHGLPLLCEHTFSLLLFGPPDSCLRLQLCDGHLLVQHPELVEGDRFEHSQDLLQHLLGHLEAVRRLAKRDHLLPGERAVLVEVVLLEARPALLLLRQRRRLPLRALPDLLGLVRHAVQALAGGIQPVAHVGPLHDGAAARTVLGELLVLLAHPDQGLVQASPRRLDGHDGRRRGALHGLRGGFRRELRKVLGRIRCVRDGLLGGPQSLGRLLHEDVHALGLLPLPLLLLQPLALLLLALLDQLLDPALRLAQGLLRLLRHLQGLRAHRAHIHLEALLHLASEGVVALGRGDAHALDDLPHGQSSRLLFPASLLLSPPPLLLSPLVLLLLLPSSSLLLLPAALVLLVAAPPLLLLPALPYLLVSPRPVLLLLPLPSALILLPPPLLLPNCLLAPAVFVL